MNRREPQTEIFFGDKKMAQIGASIILAGVTVASFINRTEIHGKFFIGNMNRRIKVF